MSNEDILNSIVQDGTGIEVTQDEALAAMTLARADERENRWTPITGEESLPKDDEALCILARYTSKGELRTTPAEKFGLLKSMFPMDEFQYYTILTTP